MSRLIIYGLLVIVGLVILLWAGWVAAPVYVFLAGCYEVVVVLISRAYITAKQYRIYRGFS